MSTASSSGPERHALVTGITGQDGSFLAELLLEHGYRVTGVVRREPHHPLGCAEHLREDLRLVRADLLDEAGLRATIEAAQPDELYHLAAPSFVPDSWQRPAETMRAIAGATGVILATARDMAIGTRVYVAASGSMFGEAGESPQRESTCARPTNPYAVAKLAAHQLVGAMREQYGLHASSGITFNHESERRPAHFVSRKITRAAAGVKLGLLDSVQLGDLGAVRDWSYAGDVVQGAWLMLQQQEPGDYVLASGVARTVDEFARAAFAYVDLDAVEYVRVDPALVRSAESTPSVGDPTLAHERLGWQPQVGFDELIERMVRADLELFGTATSRT